MTISSRPDLVLSSPLGEISIERKYRTAFVGDAAAGDGMFGKGWRANIEYQIGGAGGAGVMLFDDAGRKIFYNYTGTPGLYASPDGNGGTISKAGDGSYLWRDAKGTAFQFDPSGYLLSITDVHGNQETLGYGAVAGRITTLTDRHGRVVTFDYQGTNHVKRLLGPTSAANPAGLFATYDYDASGDLTGVTYPDGSGLIYGYENSSWPNHLTRISLDGPQGPDLRNLFQYDAQGRVSAASEGPKGRSYQLAYTSEQLILDQEYPWLGQKTLYHTTVTEWTDTDWDFQINGAEAALSQRTYSYENRGGADVVTKIEDGGCGCAAEKEYDDYFHVVQSTDNNGVTALRTYNAEADLTSLTEADGTPDERTTKYEYVYPSAPLFPGQILQKTTKRQSVVTPGDYQLSTEIYDPLTGRLSARHEQGFSIDGSPLAAETAYTYNASGSIQSIDGPRPGALDQVVYTYYGAGESYPGMLKTITEPNGAITTFQEYDGLGNLLRKTDANSRDTTYSYNSRGLLQTQTTVDGTTQYEYDAQGNLTRVAYPRGNSVSYGHEQWGVSRVADVTGRIDIGYVNGNKTSESVYDSASALVKNSTYDYDDKNRLWLTYQASGDFEEFLYDENGNVTARKLYSAAEPTVPFKTTAQGYDFLNRLTAVSVVGDPYHVSYAYDIQDNLRTVTDPVGQITSYLYDDLGRQGRVVSPETGTTEFSHDEAGNVISRRDNLNRLITYAYDGLNRLTDITYPDATPPVHYRYDGYSAGSYPDAVGRLTEVTDASGFRRFFYNPSGRLSKVIHAIDGRDFVTEYGYDANGNLASLTYPSGRTIQYGYDPASDRVQSVTSWKDGLSTVLAEGITHKPFGPLNGLQYGNGTHLVMGYENLMYRLDSLAVTGPLGDPLPTRGYDYDPAGNIHLITRDLPGGPEPHQFGYDLMDRLLGWDKPGRIQELTYDANGNRQSLADDGLFTAYAYDPVARNILAGSTGTESLLYGADPLGNITGWGTKSLVYDINSRLSRVEDGGVPLGEYVYSSNGQRVKKTTASQTAYYEYDTSGRLLHEYRVDAGVAVDYVYLDGEPLAMLESDGAAEGSLVVPLAGANGNFTPSSAQSVVYGQTATFTVTPNAGYHVESVGGCGGTLAGSIYTTGPITGDCAVTASFALNSYAIAPAADVNGSITPSDVLSIDYGQTVTFTVTPNTGYHVDSVTGCYGSLAGETYTTAPITGDCIVSANFAANSYAVTAVAGANGGITPSEAQSINYGQVGTFTVIPNTGYHIADVSGCGGTLDGNTYTTAPITGDCVVTATFDVNCYTLTLSEGIGGSLGVNPPSCIPHNWQRSFHVVPDLGYHLIDVTGCGGTLFMSDDQIYYTAGKMTADCTVTATFAPNTYTVTPSYGWGGGLTPWTPVTLTAFSEASFTVELLDNFHLVSITGCDGTLSGTTYTTSPITADCTVTATFAENPYDLTVTKSGTGSGTVTSSPAGISCGDTCSATFDARSVVSLSQTPTPGSVFSGWSGGFCYGGENCEVTMSMAQVVNATYAQGITMTAPNGGEAWQRNTTHEIRWAYEYWGSPGPSIRVELLKGGVVEKIISKKESVGILGISWKVPRKLAVGSDYQIRITSTTVAGYTDTSDAYFTIY